MGDESSVVSPTGGAAAPVQNNEELLSQIFGGTNTTAPTTTNTAPGTGTQSINDILGLFGSTSPAAPATAPTLDPLASLGSNSLFGNTTAPQAPPRAVPAPKAPGYVAYDKNQLKLTLNPQVSAQRPGVVLITARFEVSGGETAQGVNFQAAVPKVRKVLL